MEQSLIFSGFGGQGALFAGQILAGELDQGADAFPDLVVVNRTAVIAGGMFGDLEVYLKRYREVIEAIIEDAARRHTA